MKLLETIDNQSNLRNLAVMIVSSFIVVMVMAMLTQTLVYDVYVDVTMPDTRLTYTFTEITDVFNTLGQEGLNVWVYAHMLDFLFPLTYMFALAFGLNMELRRVVPANSTTNLLVLIPLVAGIADYVENIMVLSQIAAYPQLSESVILIASAVTSFKWILLYAGFAIIFLLLPLVIYRQLSSSKAED